MSACAEVPCFCVEIFFRAFGVDRAPVRNPVLKPRLRKRAGLFWRLTTSSKDDLDSLIEVGKEKGYLTYGDVNDILPDELGSADDLDDLITTIGTQGIDLLDSPKFGSDKDFRAGRGRGRRARPDARHA
jgi:hypothetical protein